MTSPIVRDQPDRRRAVIARCGCRALSLSLEDIADWLPEPVLEAEPHVAPTREQLALLNRVKQAGGQSGELTDLDVAHECIERCWLTRDPQGRFCITILGAFVTLSRRH